MKRSRYALGLAIAGAIALVAGLVITAGTAADRLLLAGLFSLPVLAALAGLCRARVYTAAWAAMLALFYLAYATVEYLVGAAHAGIDIMLVSSLALFTGCALFARLVSREAPPASA